MDYPRNNSHTPLQSTTSSGAADSKHQMSFFVNPTVAAIVAALHPRKPRQQTTLAALITLVCLTTYIFIANSTSLFQYTLGPPEPPPFDSLSEALETMKNSQFLEDHRLAHKKPPNRPPLRLEVHQELAAVSSFLASLPQNIIPPTVDPTSPIDPQLVLDFDTTGPRAMEELNAMVYDVWSRNPVFLYSKHFSQHSREVKAMLLNLNLNPSPTIIEVDTREDTGVLTPMLERLTSVHGLPILIVGGEVVGSTQEILALAKSGELKKTITAAGAQINSKKKKKLRK